MTDTEGYHIPEPTAERYFNIARGDLGEGTQNVNGPEAVQAYALLSIAKSMIDIRNLLERIVAPEDAKAREWAATERKEEVPERVPTGKDGSGGFGHQ